MERIQTNYKHSELTKAIIGCAFEVQNNLGCGFLEKVYHKALSHELSNKGTYSTGDKLPEGYWLHSRLNLKFQ